MTSEKSPYKQMGISPKSILGFSNGGRKDPGKGKVRKVTLGKKIYKILKSYHYDVYAKEPYFKNCVRALEKLFEEEKG